MRIRHYYTLVAILRQQGNKALEDLRGTFDGLYLQELGTVDGVDIISSVIDQTDGDTNKLELSRAMVQIHWQEIQERGNNPSAIESILSDFLSSLKDPAHRICIRYSLPLFFAQILIDQYGCALTEKIAKTFNEAGPITIRRNAMRCRTNEQLQSLLAKDGIRSAPSIVPTKWNHRNATDALNATYLQLVPDENWSPSTSSIWSQSLWKEGYFEVQDAGSQFIIQSMKPSFSNGEYVAVDYCAGNGGKTLALASHIFDHLQGESGEDATKGDAAKATIVAHDIVADRLKQLEGSLSRARLEDGDHAAIEIRTTTNLTDFANEREYPDSFADLVLVDAPCSSTGVLRRRPSQRFQLQEDEIRNKFPALQLSILQEASKLVKVDGILVYATCSICEFENEQVVTDFETSSFYNGDYGRLWRPACFSMLDQHEPKEEEERPVKTRLEGLGHCCNLLPVGSRSSDGFFVARWTRVK